MRKLLIIAILGSSVGFLVADEKEAVPNFRPAQVEPTTNGAVAPVPSANRPPDGMTSDLPVSLDKEICLNKIYTYWNDSKKGNRPPADNASLAFEAKYWDHGAVTAKEIQERKGNIFVITGEFIADVSFCWQ